MSFDPVEEWPFQDELRHFVSGINDPGEVRGMGGASIGIVATRCGAALLAELRDVHRWCGSELFVDSGAFSEVSFAGGKRTVVQPIDDVEWRRRLALYAELGKLYGRRALLVAPDAVGDQEATLARLATYASELQALHADGAERQGATVIVPLQRGALDAASFALRVADVLGFDDFVLGVPSKKSATTPEQLHEDCRQLYLRAGWWEPRFHLLGMGPKSKRWDEQREAIRDWFPEAPIWSDAASIRSEVGRTNGRGGGSRRLTQAQDRARLAGLQGPDVKAYAVGTLRREDAVREAQAARRAGWYDPELESAPGVPLEEGCIGYGPGGPFGDAPAASVAVQRSLFDDGEPQ